MPKLTVEQRIEVLEATVRAMRVLKKGDRVRAGRCGGIYRTYTFSHWDGSWVATASGIDDISARAIDRVNGVDVDFTKESKANHE